MSSIMYMGACVGVRVSLFRLTNVQFCMCIMHPLARTEHHLPRVWTTAAPTSSGPVIGLDFSYPPVIKNGKLRGTIEHKCVFLRWTVKLW
jgi:hypothetical protein